jgi:D-alanyl-D-alanine carboxypeptidase
VTVDLPAPPPRTPDPAACFAAARALGVPDDYGRVRNLRRVREPARLSFIGNDVNGRPQWLASRAARAWMALRSAASLAGVDLQVVSAFRSIAYQLGILQRKLERGQSIERILAVSAAPGYSEHHSGRALDVTAAGYAPLEEEFERSGAFAWLSTNAQRFNFHLSYPRGNPHGIAYEPWHWCWRPGRKAV